MREEWRDIVGFEGFYQISSAGNVKSLTRIIYQCFRGSTKNRTIKERILRFKYDIGGYRFVILQKNGLKKMMKVHRLVAIAFIPNVEGLPEVDHIDGDKRNNNIENLRWSTAKSNTAAFRLSGRSRRGDKLSWEKVQQIRNSPIMSSSRLAEEFGCSRKTIWRIRTNQSWNF